MTRPKSKKQKTPWTKETEEKRIAEFRQRLSVYDKDYLRQEMKRCMLMKIKNSENLLLNGFLDKELACLRGEIRKRK